MFEMKAQRMRILSLSEFAFTTRYKHAKLIETFQCNKLIRKYYNKNSLGYE